MEKSLKSGAVRPINDQNAVQDSASDVHNSAGSRYRPRNYSLDRSSHNNNSKYNPKDNFRNQDHYGNFHGKGKGKGGKGKGGKGTSGKGKGFQTFERKQYHNEFDKPYVSRVKKGADEKHDKKRHSSDLGTTPQLSKQSNQTLTKLEEEERFQYINKLKRPKQSGWASLKKKESPTNESEQAIKVKVNEEKDQPEPPAYCSDDEDVKRAQMWIDEQTEGQSWFEDQESQNQSFADNVDDNDDTVVFETPQPVNSNFNDLSSTTSWPPNPNQPFFSTAPQQSWTPPGPSGLTDHQTQNFARVPPPRPPPHPPPPHSQPPPRERSNSTTSQNSSSSSQHNQAHSHISNNSHSTYGRNNNQTRHKNGYNSYSNLSQQRTLSSHSAVVELEAVAPRCIRVAEVTSGYMVNGVNCELVTLSSLPWDWLENHLLCLLASIGVAAIDIRRGSANGAWVVALHPTGGGGNCHQAPLICRYLDNRTHDFITFMMAHHELLVDQPNHMLSLVVNSRNRTKVDDDDEYDEFNKEEHYIRFLLMNVYPPTTLTKSTLLKNIQVVKDCLKEKVSSAVFPADIADVSFDIHPLPKEKAHCLDGCAYLRIKCSSTATRDKVASTILKLDGLIPQPQDAVEGSEQDETQSEVVSRTGPQVLSIIPDPEGYGVVELTGGLVELPKCSVAIDKKEVTKLKAHLAVKCGLTPKELHLCSGNSMRLVFSGSPSKSLSAMQKLLALHGTSVPGLGNRGELIHVYRCQRMLIQIGPKVDFNILKSKLLDNWSCEVTSWQKLFVCRSQASRLLKTVSATDDVNEEDRLDARVLLKNCLVHVAACIEDEGSNNTVKDVSGIASFISSPVTTASQRPVWMVKDVVEVNGVFGLKIMHGGVSLSIGVNQLSEDIPAASCVARWIVAAKLASCLKIASALPLALSRLDDRELKREKLTSENRSAHLQQTRNRSSQGNQSPSISHGNSIPSLKRGRGTKKDRGAQLNKDELVAVGTIKRDRRTPQQVIRDKEARLAAEKKNEIGSLFDSDDEEEAQEVLKTTRQTPELTFADEVEDNGASALPLAGGDSWGPDQGGGSGDAHWGTDHGGGSGGDYWGTRGGSGGDHWGADQGGGSGDAHWGTNQGGGSGGDHWGADQGGGSGDAHWGTDQIGSGDAHWGTDQGGGSGGDHWGTDQGGGSGGAHKGVAGAGFNSF